MGGASNIGVPAWLAAVIGAYAISFELGAAATVGYVSQWTLKAPARIKDWVAPVAVVTACLVLYIFVLGHMPAHWRPDREWFAGFIGWAATAMGVASAAGRTSGAPKTNSL